MNGGDAAVGMGADGVLHLHCFHHDERRAPGDDGALGNQHRRDAAWHGRTERASRRFVRHVATHGIVQLHADAPRIAEHIDAAPFVAAAQHHAPA